MKRIACALVLAALAGCAAAPSRAGKGVVGELQEARDLDLYFTELTTEEGSLTKLLSPPPVDCARACDLRASIDNLARKICAVTLRMGDPERDVQCVDARRRSEIAKASVKEVCDCRSAS